jgi:hypothetical protein
MIPSKKNAVKMCVRIQRRSNANLFMAHAQCTLHKLSLSYYTCAVNFAFMETRNY